MGRECCTNGDILVAHSSPPDAVLHFEPFVGVAPHRYLELFGGIARKREDGQLVEWREESAMPRLFDLPPAELRQNQPAYRVREQLLARVVEDLEAESGLKMRTSVTASARSTTRPRKRK